MLLRWIGDWKMILNRKGMTSCFELLFYVTSMVLNTFNLKSFYINYILSSKTNEVGEILNLLGKYLLIPYHLIPFRN